MGISTQVAVALFATLLVDRMISAVKFILGFVFAWGVLMKRVWGENGFKEAFIIWFVDTTKLLIGFFFTLATCFMILTWFSTKPLVIFPFIKWYFINISPDSLVVWTILIIWGMCFILAKDYRPEEHSLNRGPIIEYEHHLPEDMK